MLSPIKSSLILATSIGVLAIVGQLASACEEFSKVDDILSKIADFNNLPEVERMLINARDHSKKYKDLRYIGNRRKAIAIIANLLSAIQVVKDERCDGEAFELVKSMDESIAHRFSKTHREPCFGPIRKFTTTLLDRHARQCAQAYKEALMATYGRPEDEKARARAEALIASIDAYYRDPESVGQPLNEAPELKHRRDYIQGIYSLLDIKSILEDDLTYPLALSVAEAAKEDGAHIKSDTNAVELDAMIHKYLLDACEQYNLWSGSVGKAAAFAAPYEVEYEGNEEFYRVVFADHICRVVNAESEQVVERLHKHLATL